MANFTGGIGNDNYAGGPDADTISGGGGDDVLAGAGGNDNIEGGAGADTLTGDAGDDILSSHTRTTVTDERFFPSLSGLISSDVFNDVDTLAGGDGDDFIFAGYGDNIDGGAVGSYGNRLYISFQGATAGVTADFRLLYTNSSIVIGGGVIKNIQNISYLEGSEYDDFLVAIDTYYPSGGNVYGRGGNDMIIASYYAGWGGSGIWGGSGNDTIDATGAQYGPKVYGENGDDVIRMRSGLGDFADGGAGNDIIYAGGGVNAGDDDDLIYRQFSYYVGAVDGGQGNDTLSYSQYGFAVTVRLSQPAGGAGVGAAGESITSIENLEGSKFADTLFGNDQTNSILGGEGNDTINGFLGADTLSGGSGDDVFNFTSKGFSSASQPLGLIDGGEGYDTIDFTSVSPVVLGTLETSPGVFFLGAYVGSQGYRIDGIEKILFGSADDTAHLPPSHVAAIELRAGAGNDSLSGQGAARLYGEEGDDIFFISGSFGTPATSGAVDGGTGTDLLKLNIAFTVDLQAGTASSGSSTFSIAGIEQVQVAAVGGYLSTVFGSNGDEILSVNPLFDDSSVGVIFEGRGGNDSLTGSNGDDRLDGGDGNDFVNGGFGNDMLFGGSGDDVLIGFGGSDVLQGGAGNDIYIIDAGDTVVEYAGDGIDEVRTQAGIFVLSDALENLRATSDVGHDFRGNAGNNVIVGGDGNDIIRSQDGGDDLLFGKAGVDSFYMGGSFDNGDFIDGGDNRDSLILQGNYNLTLTWNITGGSSLANIEGISLLPGNVTQYGDPGTGSYSYNLTLVDGNVAAGQLMKVNGINLRVGENFTLDAAAELDAPLQVFAGFGIDTLKGGQQGDSFIFAHDGRFGAGDTVDGGAGYDVFYLRGDYVIDFNAVGYTGALTAIESIALLTSQNTEFAGGGDGEFDYDITWNDTLLAAGQSITINASRLGENESLDFDGSREADGTFRLFGGAGSDFLTGGKANDLIYGGGNGDILTGGGGNDTFRYQSTDDSRSSGNRDGIQDFSIGDKIDLQRIDADVLTDGDQAFTFIGSGAFTGHAGELRAVNAAGFPTAWTVYADVDGDGHEDLTIFVQVIEAHPLTAADFVM